MDGHDRVVFHKALSTGGAGVENLDHSLHFEIMIALSERAHFGARAFYRAIRDVLGHSASHLAGFLDALEIARIFPTPLDRPSRPVDQHGVHFGLIEVDRAGAAHAPRTLAGGRVCPTMGLSGSGTRRALHQGVRGVAHHCANQFWRPERRSSRSTTAPCAPVNQKMIASLVH